MKIKRIVLIVVAGCLSGFLFPNTIYSQPVLYEYHTVALTGLEVQQRVGSGWETVEKYRHGSRYRVRLRILNRYNALGDVRIRDIYVKLRLPYARWNAKGRKEELDKTYLRDATYNNALRKRERRWYTFGEFTWQGKAEEIRMMHFYVEIRHQSIADREGRWGKTLPN